MNPAMNALNALDEIKEKLTDGEYKKIADALTAVHKREHDEEDDDRIYIVRYKVAIPRLRIHQRENAKGEIESQWMDLEFDYKYLTRRQSEKPDEIGQMEFIEHDCRMYLPSGKVILCHHIPVLDTNDVTDESYNPATEDRIEDNEVSDDDETDI